MRSKLPGLAFLAALVLPALAVNVPRQDDVTSGASMPIITSGNFTVNSAGDHLAYTDTGAPRRSSTYITIIAIHGLTFTNQIFERIMDLASDANLRIVSVSRRGYPGSSPISSDDMNTLTNGSNDQKAASLDGFGLELLTFVDKFIVANNIPACNNTNSGGIAFLGWSLGNVFSNAAIANVGKLPADAQARLAARLRSNIMLEPPELALGLPSPPGNWAPTLDDGIPAESRAPLFVQWITSYFAHGDLSKRDPSLLSYVVPTLTRPPSIWGMTQKEISDVVYADGFKSDLPFLFGFDAMLLANYQTACFDTTLRSLLKSMKVWMVTGDATASFSIISMWEVQDDDNARGGGHVNYKVLPGGNHFIFWDEPSRSLDYIQGML